MPIPKSRAEAICLFVLTVFGICCVLIAMVDLCCGVSLIASFLWLALVAAMLWTAAREEGGLRNCLVKLMGKLFGRHFVEAEPTEAQPGDIRFGFQLLGRRFIQQRIPLDSIESVEWSTGQASAMAGRAVNDWQVAIWFDSRDSTKSEQRRKFRKPDQCGYCVGHPARKDRTEALGLSLVAFLRAAGADLVQDAATTCFVVRRPAAREMKSVQSTAAPNGRS